MGDQERRSRLQELTTGRNPVAWLSGAWDTHTVEAERSDVKDNPALWLKWTSENDAAQTVLNKMRQRLQKTNDEEDKETKQKLYQTMNTFLLKATARRMCPMQPRDAWPIRRTRTPTPVDVEWVCDNTRSPYIDLRHSRVATAPPHFTRILRRTLADAGSRAGYRESALFTNQLDENKRKRKRSLTATARSYAVDNETTLFSDRTRLPNVLPVNGQFTLTPAMAELPSARPRRDESVRLQDWQTTSPPDPYMLPLELLSGTQQDKSSDVPLHNLVFRYTKLENPEAAVAVFQHYQHLELVWQGALKQIQVMIYNYSIPKVILMPAKLIRFLKRYQFTPSAVYVSRADLVGMSTNKEDIGRYLFRPGQRFTADLLGEHRAAQCIQAAWRGCLARRKCKLRDTVFVASAVLASAFLCFKRRQEMSRTIKQLKGDRLMRTSQRMAMLKANWQKLQSEHHVVLQLPSLGHVLTVRQALGSTLPIVQNYQFCRCIGWLANSLCHVVYVSPVKLTTDLINFYNYFSLKILGGSLKKCAHRIRFMHVDRVQCFWDRGFNLSRLLVCAPSTLINLKTVTSMMPGYVIPGLMDYQDIIVADELNIPIYGPPLGLQTQLANKSHVGHFLAGLGVSQPPEARHINDTVGLVKHLSKLIALYPDIHFWLLKMNCDIDGQGTAYLRSNPATIPFMPWILKERLRFGQDWELDEKLRERVIAELATHLRNNLHLLVCFVNNQRFQSWRAFKLELAATGCMVQASPPGRSYGVTFAIEITPVGAHLITCIADQVKLEKDTTFRVWGYSWPVTSVTDDVISKIQRTAHHVAVECKKIGYVGHFALDFIVFKDMQKQQLEFWLVDLDPYCTELHSFHQCVMKLGGGSDAKPAVCSAKLHHSNLAVYRWHTLEGYLHSHKIAFDHEERDGSLVMLLDGEVRESLAMVTIHTDHKMALQLFSKNLWTLHNYITDSDYEYATNFLDAASEIESLLHRNNSSWQNSSSSNIVSIDSNDWLNY